MEFEKDYYDILDISPTATDEEIRSAYRTLVKEYHPDANVTTKAKTRFFDVQEAYDVLNNQTHRKRFDHWLIHQKKGNQSSALSLYAVPSHKTLTSMSNEQAFYLFLSIMSTEGLSITRLPLNICLIIDKSTSMKGIRLQKVKKAIHQIIDKLRPEDALGLVVFSDRASVLIQSEKEIDPPKAKAVVSTIQPGGGTEIYQGLKAGVKEIERHKNDQSVNHIILLTDGQTYGDEKECLEQAEQAIKNDIHISTIGIGSDWNEDLLDNIAGLSSGNSVFIDEIEDVDDIFSDTIRDLGSVVARQLAMRIDNHPDIKLHEAYQISPYITSIDVENNEVKLGALSADQEKSLLLEFRIKNLNPGHQTLPCIMVEGDMPGHQIKRTWESVTPEVEVTLQPMLNASIPSFISTALSKLSIYKMQEKVSADIKAGNVKQATSRLHLMATQLLSMGEPELSKVALLEAGQLTRTAVLSPTGSKKIRYGTRALSSPNDSPRMMTMPIG